MKRNDRRDTIASFRRNLLAPLVCLALSATSHDARGGGTVLYGVRYDGIVDNREYFGTPGQAQTFFLGRLTLAGGLSGADTAHRVCAELSALQEFGGKDPVDQIEAALYYRYRARFSRFLIGVFPRDLTHPTPRALLDDSVRYFRPNIEGLHLEAGNSWGRQSIMVDWLGRQTATVSEEFMVEVSGNLWARKLFLDYHFAYWHFASRDVEPPDPLSEECGGWALVGFGTGQFGPVDTLSIGAGVLASAARTRHITTWDTPAGGVAELNVALWRIGLHVQGYAGQPQHLTYGDPLYGVPWYVRSDVSFVPIVSKVAQGAFTWGLHLSDAGLHHSHMFMLTCALGSQRSLSRK